MVKRAIQISQQDFELVIEGAQRDQMLVKLGQGRTVEQCRAAGVGGGVQTTGRQGHVAARSAEQPSLHPAGRLRSRGGSAYPLDWSDPRKFDAIAAAMRLRASWGGGALGCGLGQRRQNPEKGETDSPRFEL